MTLQEKTTEALISHTLEVNRFSLVQRNKWIREINQLLQEIKVALNSGNQFVSMKDLRDMMSDSKRLFKKGFKDLKNTIKSDVEELLKVELENQTKLLQNLIDEYEIPYSMREPSFILTNRDRKDQPLRGMINDDWLTLWETKLESQIQSKLYSELDGETNREQLVTKVFGNNAQPLNEFKRNKADVSGLFLALLDSTYAVTSENIAKANPGMIKGVMWNSCLCSTTCGACASLHGAIRLNDGEDETGGNEIPLHPNCLCHWSYIYNTPSEMNTQVPKEQKNNINSDMTQKKSDMWYNTLSKERKIELVGKTKYKMVQDKQLTFSQLLTQEDRRIYSIEELINKGYRVPKI